MVMYANEFKTKENQKLAEIQKLTATYALQHLPHPQVAQAHYESPEQHYPT